MDELLTAHLLLALLGGIVGGFRAAIREYPPRSRLVRLSDFTVGVACAISFSHYAPKELPLLAVGYGVVSGTLAAYALDIIHEFLPRILKLAAKLRFGVSWDDNK